MSRSEQAEVAAFARRFSSMTDTERKSCVFRLLDDPATPEAILRAALRGMVAP